MLNEWLEGDVGKITECWLNDCEEVWKDNWMLIEWLRGGVGKITECWLNDCEEVLER